MRKRAAFPVVVATDGSPQARAAVTGAAAFPWPAGARLRLVLARGGVVAARWPAPVLKAFTRSFERVALRARRILEARWPDVDVAIVEQPAVEGIIAQARRFGAKAIVVGSRGQGALGRFVLGSVSRGLVRRARCPVLVVKGRPREIRRLVIGLDGSANSRHAVAFVAGLDAPAGGHVTLLRVVEPMRPLSAGLLPASVRAVVGAQAAALEAQRLREARRELDAAAQRLTRAGWTVRTEVRTGVPVHEILDVVTAARAHLLVVGARGVGGVEQLLLGSVAEGALTRSPVSVLVVK